MSSPGSVPSAASSAASAALAPAARACSAARARTGTGAHVGQRDPAADGGHAHDGPVVGPPGELLVPPGAARAARHPDRGEQLVRLPGGLEVAGEEVVGRDAAGPARPRAAPPSRPARAAPSAGRRPGRRAPASRRSCRGAGSAGRRPARRRARAAAHRPGPAPSRPAQRAGWSRRSPGRRRRPGCRPGRPPGRCRSAPSAPPAAASSSAAASARRPAASPRRRTAPAGPARAPARRRRPTYSNGAGITAPASAVALLRGGQHRAHDVVVAGAAAEVALQALAHLASVGCGFSASRPTAAITMPGVQNPHCRPCSCRNASCTGCSSPPLVPAPRR